MGLEISKGLNLSSVILQTIIKNMGYDMAVKKIK